MVRWESGASAMGKRLRRGRKHWLKVAPVERRDIALVAREDIAPTVRRCDEALTVARQAGTDQPLSVPQEIDAQDGSTLMPRHALEELTAPLASYDNAYAFRLLREWGRCCRLLHSAGQGSAPECGGTRTSAGKKHSTDAWWSGTKVGLRRQRAGG